MQQVNRKFRGANRQLKRLAISCLLGLGLVQGAGAAQISITVENLTATDGLFLTPVWVGFHDGSFDAYDTGSPASAGLESIAEDGDPGTIGAEFAASSAGINDGVAGVIFGPAGFAGAPIIDPGETTSAVFTLDPTKNRYFNFLSMVIPSNDAFIGNDDPLALFDDAGNFLGLDLYVWGSDVKDAGTEVNNEMDAAFFNQMAPNTGLTEAGVVSSHAGFIGSQGNPGGTPIILGGTNPPGFFFDPVKADFTRDGYKLARITITDVPEPGSLALLGLGLLGLAMVRVHRPQ